MKKIINRFKRTPSFCIKIVIPLSFIFLFLFPLFYYLILIWHSGIAENYHSYFKVKGINNIEFLKQQPANWVKLDNISNAAVWSVIVSEDWAFYEHSGVDWQQLMLVLREGAKKLSFKRGASTITQQVVKNLFLTNEKSYFRKLNEIILAYYLEEKVTKKWILEQYLNLAEFDKNVFGIKSAARHFFSKHPANLSFKEGAFLSMLLPSPKKYAISYYKKNLTPYARKQVTRILAKLVIAHIMTKDQMLAEVNSPFSWESTPETGTWDNLDSIIEGVKKGEEVDESLIHQGPEESVPAEEDTSDNDMSSSEIDSSNDSVNETITIPNETPTESIESIPPADEPLESKQEE